MNQKTAKQLRKVARELFLNTEGAKNDMNPYVEIERNRKPYRTSSNNIGFSEGTRLCNPATERGIYRAMKHTYRQQNR